MPTIPTKSAAPSAAHLAYRKAIEQAMRDHGADLRADELLAVTAHLVGQLIALQDQRVMTPEMAIALVQQNMEQGNREVVEGLMHQTGGHA